MRGVDLPSVEELLLPLLKLLSRRALTLQHACKELARELPIAEVERWELERNFSGSRFNPKVSGAWTVLERAGLLQEGPVRWTKVASASGRNILALGLQCLTIKRLEELLPEYAALHRADEFDRTVYGFRDLALEYYACGRRLMKEAAFSAAPVLLSYAIEMILKAGLHRSRERWTPDDKKLIGKSHDLVKLYTRAKEMGETGQSTTGAPFADTNIAIEFMAYASDNFARRYPSGENKRSGGRNEWSIGTTKLSAYDDCICQLDDSLATYSKTPQLSIVYAALHDRNPLIARLAPELFLENAFALRLAGKYLDVEGQDSNGYLAALRADPLRLRHFIASTQQRPDILALQLAAWFCYPKDGEPDPDPLLTSNVSAPLDSSPAGRIVSRLRSEFGQENVRLVSASPSADHMIVQVFDRTATMYWREFRLKGVLRGVTTLDDAIAKARRQFKEKRPEYVRES
jgi:hypothetical protein